MKQAARVRQIDETATRETIDSAALARLLEEVRNNVEFSPNAYNRMHNRHNR